MDLAAVDCAMMETRQVCLDYGITGYPTIKVHCGGALSIRFTFYIPPDINDLKMLSFGQWERNLLP